MYLFLVRDKSENCDRIVFVKDRKELSENFYLIGSTKKDLRVITKIDLQKINTEDGNNTLADFVNVLFGLDALTGTATFDHGLVYLIEAVLENAEILRYLQRKKTEKQ